MLVLLWLSYSFAHPVQLAPRAFQPLLHLLLLRVIHLCHSRGEPAASAAQNRQRHLQIPPQVFHRCRRGGRRLTLRFPEQLRLGQNPLARGARALPPGRIQLSGLTRIAMMRDEDCGHLPALFSIYPSHRHQVLHRYLRRDLARAHLALNRFRQ